MINSARILGTSKVVNDLISLIKIMAASDATVLISGESGTGKELIAKNLHLQSKRSKHKFVPVNCAAIPRDLIESELFGHRKGSFTGALSDRIGRFELANGGTLFLDEIGDLPSEVQVKLLRVIQERVVDPIGSLKPTPIDVRIISATHRNLEKEIKTGSFREDLYYRLNVLPICSPPLRDRSEDIELLIDHFIAYGTKSHEKVKFDACLIQAFKNYEWPGNIRELSNIVARLATLFPGRLLKLNDIPSIMLPSKMPREEGLAFENSTDEHNPVEEIISLAQGNSETHHTENIADIEDKTPLKSKLAEFEKVLITKALKQSNGNVSKTAKLLCVQRTTLIEKINKYSIDSS